MFPSSPRPDLFARRDDLYPEPTPPGLRLAIRLRVLTALLGVGAFIAIGPYASLPMWNVKYREFLAGPATTERQQRMHRAILSMYETMAWMGIVPALFWLAGMIYAVTLLRRPQGRWMGGAGLAFGAATLLFGVIRLAPFVGR